MTQLSKADLHIHTVHSDGAATVPELLAHVVAKTDLRLIAITDHDSIVGAKEAVQLARAFGIEVVIGEEVSTADGHLLALFIDSLLLPYRPAVETIAAIHAQGGLAIAAHPFDRSVPSLGSAGLDQPGWQFDAIEGFNGGVIWSQRACNPAARQTARELGLAVVAGSDAHSLATVGQGYTLFPGHSANDLYRTIKRNEVRWGGSYWSLQQYVDLGRQLLRQRGVFGSLGLAARGLGLIAHQDS
jgi:predicted metal-dependent phosphoesterase TrpH